LRTIDERLVHDLPTVKEHLKVLSWFTLLMGRKEKNMN